MDWKKCTWNELSVNKKQKKSASKDISSKIRELLFIFGAILFCYLILSQVITFWNIVKQWPFTNAKQCVRKAIYQHSILCFAPCLNVLSTEKSTLMYLAKWMLHM